MNKSTYMIFVALLAIVLVAGVVIAEAQNYTIGMVMVYTGDNNLDYLSLNDINLTVTCNNGLPNSVYDGDNSFIYFVFNDSFCDSSSNIKVSASKGKLSYSGSLNVEKCVINSSEDSGYCSNRTGEDGIVNYAYGVVELKETEPVKKKSSSGGGSSSSTKVVKNTTIATVPKQANISLGNISDVAEPEIENVSDIEENDDGDVGSGITGGVIGALKSNMGFVALIFIAAVLVAYMFVLRRRKSAYY